jgi:hypothetical protein
VSPEIAVQGAAVTDWYTPVTAAVLKYGSTTATNIDANYPKSKIKRNGDSADILIAINLSGAANASGGMTFVLPDGLAIDTNKLPDGTADEFIGSYAEIYTNSKYFTGTIRYNDANSVYVRPMEGGTSSSGSGGVTATSWTGHTTAGSNVPSGAALGSSDFIVVSLKNIPIVGWSSNVTMANRAVEEFAYNTATADSSDTTSFGYGASGVQFGSFSTATRTKRVRFQTPIQQTDVIDVEVYWNGAWVRARDIGLASTAATTGIGISNVIYGSTDLDINFGSAGYAASVAAGASAWSGIAGSASYKWRVRKVSGGAVVGYPIGARNIVGDTTGTTVPSGYIGETVEATLTTTTATTSYADVNGASLALTPGKWRISYAVSGSVATATSTGNASTLVTAITNSANTIQGTSARILYCITRAAASNSVEATLAGEAIVTVTSADTYKLRLKKIDNSGTGTVSVTVSSDYGYHFNATRIA